jgi:hypothetical protein
VDEAKIQFSPSEMDLMCNAQLILTKNRILHGVKTLFEGIEQELVKRAYYIDDDRLRAMLEPLPKISRGENYGGLPYVVLDFPRHFDSINIFAIRTMFWWGHEFSSTLHLSGGPKLEVLKGIEEAYDTLAKHHYYIGVNEDPWQHHFEEDNYLPVSEMSQGSFEAYCRQWDHLKIAAKWRLTDIHFVAEDLLKSWSLLLRLCES